MTDATIVRLEDELATATENLKTANALEEEAKLNAAEARYVHRKLTAELLEAQAEQRREKAIRARHASCA